MKVLIASLAILFSTTAAFAQDQRASCLAQLENLARQISSSTGMDASDAVGLANPSDVEADEVTVYIGSSTDFDRYVIQVKDWHSCDIEGLQLFKRR